MPNDAAVDASGVIPLGFMLGTLVGFLFWIFWKENLNRRFDLEKQIRIGTTLFVVSFFVVSPVTLMLMHTVPGAFIGTFLFASVEVFFMIVVQAARLEKRKRP